MSRTITILTPPDWVGFEPEATAGQPIGLVVGVASYAECEVLERHLVTDDDDPIRLEYRRTNETARVFSLSPATIPADRIAIAAMTEEGYWELVSVIC